MLHQVGEDLGEKAQEARRAQPPLPKPPESKNSNPRVSECFVHFASTVNPRKLEHGFRRIGARIPYTLL